MKKYFPFLVRLFAAIILLQTLYFKFTGAEESKYIFEQLGLEPNGRIGIGVLELICAVLLLIPKTSWMGAGLGIGLMGGALMSHITTLGIEVQDDGGYLFILALIVLACCSITLWIERRQIPIIKNLFPR